MPHCPVITVVTPCITRLSAVGPVGKVKSAWEWTSMKPGHMINPSASIDVTCLWLAWSGSLANFCAFYPNIRFSGRSSGAIKHQAILY